MTNIHQDNIPYYHAVLDNLRAGREHGLQYRSVDAAWWSDFNTVTSSGMPIYDWGKSVSENGFGDIQMKPEDRARETIKIGALVLPAPLKDPLYVGEHYFQSFEWKENNEGRFVCSRWENSEHQNLMLKRGQLFKASDGAVKWSIFCEKLRIGDPETIAAITQQAKVDELEEKLQQITEAYTEQLEMRERARLIRDKLANLSPEICRLIVELECISLEQLRLRQVAPITRSEEYVSLVDKYDAAADKIVSLQAKINELSQQLSAVDGLSAENAQLKLDIEDAEEEIAELRSDLECADLEAKNMREYGESMYQKLDAVCEKFPGARDFALREFGINTQQQREIDRDALAEVIRNESFKESNWQETEDAVIEQLNAKPVERKQLPWYAKCGISRAEWNDKAWELYHNKTFEDLQLSKVNLHTIRTIFNATYDALMPATQEPENITNENMLDLLKRLQRPAPSKEVAEIFSDAYRFITGMADIIAGMEEPKELVMPSDDDLECRRTNFNIVGDMKCGIRLLFEKNADLFRERGVVVPKELK